MTVAEFLDEADLELAAVQRALDTAQRALDTAQRTHRVGRTIRRLVRRVLVVAAVALLGAAVVYVLRAWLGRGGPDLPEPQSAGPDQNGSVTAGAVSSTVG